MSKDNKGQSLYKKELGWYVWLENAMNEMQMMAKSASYILFIALAVSITAAWIDVKVGLWKMNHDLSFFFGFIKLCFAAIGDESKRDLWLNALSSISWDLFSTLAVHSVFGFAVGFLLWEFTKGKSEEMGESKFISGTKLISEAMRLKQIQKLVEAGKMKWRLKICRIPLPYESEVNSFMGVAAAGGGKGVLAHIVMKIIGAMKDAKGIVHDKKPEYAQKYFWPQRGDLIFNPIDQRSIKYTISNDFEDTIDIETFCQIVVPHNPQAKDHFWDDSSREILLSVVTKLWEHDQCTNENIRTALYMSPEELSMWLHGYKGSEYAARKDSLATLRTKMAWISYMPDGDFSIREWIDKAPRGLIFLTNTEKTEALFAPIISVFVSAAASHVLNLPDNSSRRIFFFLDEFTSLRKIDAIPKLLRLGRSKGVSVWLLFQSMQMAALIYGKDIFDEIVNNCKNKAIGQTQDSRGAQYWSETFGKQVFEDLSTSKSMGVQSNKDGQNLQDQRREEFVVKASDLLNLEERKFYIKINRLEGVTLSTADIIDIPDIAEGFVKREMTKAEWVGMMKAGDKAESMRVMEATGKTITNDEEIEKASVDSPQDLRREDDDDFSF